MVDVGNMDVEFVAVVIKFCYGDGVIEIFCICVVNGDNDLIMEIMVVFYVFFIDGVGCICCLFYCFGWKVFW